MERLNKTQTTLNYDDMHREHFIRYKSFDSDEVNSISFPSLRSVQERLYLSVANYVYNGKSVPISHSLAKKQSSRLAGGIALWELGQMLPMFIDLI